MYQMPRSSRPRAALRPAHQAATGAPTLAHQTHVSASSFQLRRLLDLAGPLRSGPHKAAAIRWNVINQHPHTPTCLRSTEVPWNVGSRNHHPPMQALNFGFRLQTTPEPASQRPPGKFCLGAETNEFFRSLNRSHLNTHTPSTLLLCCCPEGFAVYPPCIRSFYNQLHPSGSGDSLWRNSASDDKLRV